MNSLKSPIFIAFLLMIFITNHNESNAQTIQEDFDDFISCFDKEQFDDCAKLGSQLLLRLNDNFEMYYSVNYVMAIIEYERKNYPKALQYVEISLLINESMSQFTDIQGRGNWLKSEILGAQGKSGASYRCLKKASKYIRSAEFHSTVAYRLIEKGKYKKAVKLATSAIYIDPSYAYAYNNRGLAYLRLNKMEKAKVDFKKSKELDADNPYLYHNMALVYIEENKLDKVCDELKKGRELALQKKILGSHDQIQQDIEKLQSLHCN